MAEVSLADAFIAVDVALKSGSPRVSLLIPSSLTHSVYDFSFPFC
jgi:hypothetical protein